MTRYRFLGGAYHSDMRRAAGQQIVTLPGKSPASAQTRNATSALQYEKRTITWQRGDGRRMHSEVYVDRSKTVEEQQPLVDDYRDQMGG